MTFGVLYVVEQVLSMGWTFLLSVPVMAGLRESRVEDGVSGSLRSIATTIHLKHELRCGARGQLYMGMNLNSGELCTVR
ncbi:hypothetical protein HanOQP8_Chr08g0291831 [Helianthus annuus]|nr:hypothetical protein HanIR_Chr08g0372801 [Helianthus annuus]KAJ0719665.1 hypothetical protein HanLR1_Chr08g0284301 [Helianthus annuus]KAJ0722894.1 hypothetical protein HanOQP8_Chr08g0291831 [Helianthus annuus]